jgi:hypothetical protein
MTWALFALFVCLAALIWLLPFLHAVVSDTIRAARREHGVTRRVRAGALGILSVVVSLLVFPLMLLVMTFGWLLHGLSIVGIAVKGR